MKKIMESFLIFESPSVENVNPIDHFKESLISSMFGLNLSFLRKSKEYYNLPIRDETIIKYSLKEASENWFEHYELIENIKIPKELFLAVFESKKKKQVELLKNVTINSDILLALIFKLWKDHGFKFSRYKAQHFPNGTNENKLPKFACLNDGKINKIGESNLSDGQIKQVIENRKVIISNFFDNDKSWCCLFITFDSLKGKEGWENNSPHYHFISDKFGLPKVYVINQLKSKHYKLGSLPHIKILK